jgi:hypothetical protein
MFGPESKLFPKQSKIKGNSGNSQYPGANPGDIPDWKQSYEYDAGTEVKAPDNNYYRCVQDHVSNNFASDLGSGKWTIFAGPGINTDHQVLSLDPDNVTLRLSGGLVPDSTVDLTPFLDNTDDQVLSLDLDGTTLRLSNGTGSDTTVDLSPFLDNTDSQQLSLTGNTLSLTNGGSVDLSPYLDNTDAQQLSLTGNTLSLTGGGSVDLSPFLDNTDSQTLSILGNTLSISGGNSVPLPASAGNSVVSELSFATNVVDTRVGAGAMATVYSIPYAINPAVTDGKTRRLQYIANYTKTVGVTTTDFEFVVGGIVIPFTSTAIGNAAITNGTYVLNLLINFRAGNQAYVGVEIKRYDPLGVLVQTALVKSPVGTWDKTIANTIDFRWQVVSGTTTNTITILDVTSELI